MALGITEHPILLLATAVAAMAGVPPQGREMLRVSVLSCIHYIEAQVSTAPVSRESQHSPTSLEQDPHLPVGIPSRDAYEGTQSLWSAIRSDSWQQYDTPRQHDEPCRLHFCIEKWQQTEVLVAFCICTFVPMVCVCALLISALLFVNYTPDRSTRRTWTFLQAIQSQCALDPRATSDIASRLDLNRDQTSDFISKLRLLMAQGHMPSH